MSQWKCSILSFPVKPKLQFVVNRKNAYLLIHVYNKQIYSFVLLDWDSAFSIDKESSYLLIPSSLSCDMGFLWSVPLFLFLC